MDNFKSLTDEELMSRITQLSGDRTQQPKNSYANMTDEELLSSINVIKENTPLLFLKNGLDTRNSKSPLSLTERARLSFFDEGSKESYLRKKFNFVEKLENGKFAVGNDPRDLSPIDPEGLFNDILGDAADIVSSIPMIAGQIVGSVAGISGGPAGIVGGGAIGAGAGEALSKGIGAYLGSNESPESIATDIALSTALGAIGEGIGVAAKSAGGKIFTSAFKRAADSSIKNAPSKATAMSSAEKLAKVFHITASIPENATITASKYGFENTFKPEYLSEKSLNRISNILKRGVKFTGEKFGREVGAAENELTILTGNRKVIDLTDTYRQLVSDLKNIGVLNSNNTLNKAYPAKGLSIFDKLLKTVGRQIYLREPKIGSFGKTIGKRTVPQYISPNKKFTVSEVLRLKRQYGDVFDDVSPQGKSVLFRFLRDFDERTKRKTSGLDNKIAQVAEKLNTKRLENANIRFSRFNSLLSDISAQGSVDFSNPNSIENFIKGYLNKNPSVHQAFNAIDEVLPGRMSSIVEKFSAAQAFKGANPNLLRVGAVMSYAGLGGGENLLGKTLKLGTGFALTTPSGIRGILKAASKIKAGGKATRAAIKKGLSSTQLKGADRATVALISRMLYSRSKGNQ